MDPEEFRKTGHRVVDRLADYFAGLEKGPVFPDVDPAELERLFDEPMPQEPSTAEAVLAELDAKLFPYCTQVGHPGYFGLITPSPTPAGVLGDFIASALNQNLGAYSIGPAAVAMERRTVRWLTDLVGYDAAAGGNLTSGGMMANFIGLKLARDAVSGDRAQQEGVEAPGAVYVSEERHVSVDKAVDAVGLGRSALRALPTDDRFRLRLGALEAAIAADRRAGLKPVCLVGMFGTTNTGAIDPLPELRRIADREGMWLHVDAAYGGGALLATEFRPDRSGLESADSITFDPHKWFYAPLDVGAILVRDGRRLTVSFGLKPAYLTDEFDAEGARYQYYVHGFEQSRRFRGLKIWMSLRRYGARQIGDWIAANMRQARRLHALATAGGEFEAAMAPPLSAICLRYLSAPRGGEHDFHARVAQRVEQQGEFWISTTVLKGKTWFRINPVNFRTRLEQMDRLLELLGTECRRQEDFHAEAQNDRKEEQEKGGSK